MCCPAQLHRIVEVLYAEAIDESSKTLVLSLLLEYGGVLLADALSRVEHTLSALQAVLLRPSSGAFFRSHILGVLVGIAIDHDILVTLPPVFTKCGAHFCLGQCFGLPAVNLLGRLMTLAVRLSCSRIMDLLFEFVAIPNNPNDTMSRRTACQCLTELEQVYPGLLAGKIGHLMNLAQREYTHVFQVR